MAGTGYYAVKETPAQNDDTQSGAPVGQVITLVTGGLGGAGAWKGGYITNVTQTETRAIVSHTDGTVTLEGDLANWVDTDDLDIFDAWGSIQGALDQLWTDQDVATFTASQYIRVFAGTYDENVVPNAALDPNEANGFLLIIEGDPTDSRANIRLEPTTGKGIYVNCDYALIRHMHVHTQESSASAHGIQSDTGAAALRVEDCEVQTTTSAQCVSGRQGVQILDSVLASATGIGAYVNFSYGSFVKRCSITTAGQGMYFGRGGLTVESVVFSGCAIGIWLLSLYQRTLDVRECSFYGCAVGVDLSTAEPTDIEVVLINNIFKDCVTNLEMPATNVWPEETATRLGPFFLLRNNCFHGYTNFVTDGVTPKTYAQFAAFDRVDSSGNKDATDPLLTNPGSGDFSLQSNSPCRHAGIGAGVVKDVNGDPFDPYHPDIGAVSTGIGPNVAYGG
jgi:hypothetical protein